MAWPQPDYIAAVERAGAEVRTLSPETDRLPAALEGCDGVLLTGGPDVDPVEYGEAERHPTVEVDPVRDAYEIALARQAIARDLPLFAICRGAQVLNVAAGGTLVQDIPSQHPTDLTHSVTERRDAIAHDVLVTKGTRLAALLGDALNPNGHFAVNSRHHQSVKAPAPGFIASAHAPDGVIEAIEKTGGGFCVGVQWHPENFWRTGQFSTLFSGLIEAAKTRQK